MPRAMSERLVRASPEVADRFPRRSDFLISSCVVVVHEWKPHGREERRARQHAPRLEVDPEFTLALSCSKSRAACRGGRVLGARSWSLLRTRPDASVRLSLPIDLCDRARPSAVAARTRVRTSWTRDP